MITPAASKAAFHKALADAERVFLSKLKRLESLRQSMTVLLYGYGTRGQQLAAQLRAIGVNPIIYDSDPNARRKAALADFETVEAIHVAFPLVVSAAQNQLNLSRSYPDAYTLVECQYAHNLTNQCDPAPLFSTCVLRNLDIAYAVYELLEESSRAGFLDLLRFRVSLDVRSIASTRLPLAFMWQLPLERLAIHTFCDAGAYDGDTIDALSSRTRLTDVLAIEPNEQLESAIRAVAHKHALNLDYFRGAAWSHKCILRAIELSGGMVAVEESANGAIAAEPLDSLSTRAYDFLKFDVEGAERRSLVGGSKSVSAAKAVAVASYHRNLDIFELPLQLDAMRKNARSYSREASCLHFRHYSECFDDSIFYHF
jgi:FkbM family methyltransferase